MQIDRVAIKNYRSIKDCDVELQPLTFLIGANASGKTSFVDAILFVASALRNSLEKAISERGGIYSILHQPVELPSTITFDLYFSAIDSKCEFHLELSFSRSENVSVTREQCSIEHLDGQRHRYLVEGGRVTGSAAVFPAVSVDRVFLANASGLPEFRAAYDFLSRIVPINPMLPDIHITMQVLNAVTKQMNPNIEEKGLAVRIRDLEKEHPERLEMVQQYLRVIAPPFEHLSIRDSNGMPVLIFVEKSQAGRSTWFNLKQVSAGLVHATDVLVQLFKSPHGGSVVPIVIEEPEAFLHPAAIQVMRDAFIEASRTRQVIVTTHSPDLLDDPSVSEKWIRVVHRDDAGTHVEALGAATESIIRDQLYTPGQLLRQGGLLSETQ